MGKSVFITGFKGGSGKTTVSAFLASVLRFFGKKVIVVDADFNMRCMDMVLGMEHMCLFDCADVLSGKCGLDEAVIERNGISLLPAPAGYDGGDIDADRLAEIFGRLNERFDFIIIDSAAEPGRNYMAFASQADETAVLSLHQSSSVRVAEKTALRLEKAGIKNIRLIINCYFNEYAQNGILPGVYDMIYRSSVRLLGVIPHNSDVIAFQESGILLFSGGGNRYIRDFEAAAFNIACRLCGKNVPLLEDVFSNRKTKYFIKKWIGESK